MSSSSWLTSLECSNPLIQSSDGISYYISVLIHWLRFIFLSPCSQRVALTSIDLLFIVAVLLLGVQKICLRFMIVKDGNSGSNSIDYKQLLGSDQASHVRIIDHQFNLSLTVTALLALSYSALSCFRVFSHGISIQSPSSWQLIEATYQIAQAVTFIVAFLLVAHAKKSETIVHLMHLRVYWTASFGMSTLFATSAFIRLISCKSSEVNLDMRIDDVFSLVSLPISVFLFVVAIWSSSGLSCFTKEPHQLSLGNNVCGYAMASWFSKGMWLWMNPLLSTGYESPLTMDQIPSLPPDYQAEKMAALFEMNWPKPDENSKNPVRTTLIRCFWKEIIFTGFLSVVKLAVMYIGPIMIQKFVNFTSRKQSSNYEGYYLVLTLLVAKIVEVLSSHHLNFQSRITGMLIRSSLITSLYKKGLKLSCSSRQSHGVGPIVNYMVVDCQQLSDMMLQLHPIWLMPFQVGVALALLYGYMGSSVLAAFAGVVAVMLFTMLMTVRNNGFMYNLMKDRDLRMKATIEMLNNMRVIKLQAWEDHFNSRIQSCRESEYCWLTKFIYSISWNQVLLTTSPIVIAALTFTVAVSSGIFLDAGIVFTAVTLLRILQEPIQTFPQALVSITQAMISLQRLDKYFTSSELESESVETEEDCGSNIAVQVKDGTFSWVDEGSEEVLKKLNLEIKKGELAAIVGTVGSGKSSLLASILGELHKVSGTVRVSGSRAYVAQTSWIQNATLQENILFGSPMNNELYREALRVCCLEKDLETLEHGDQTEIGERGINLSGGQKQRIQLARAVYQDCDIYLLDDVFSAVDAHTGSEIFKECVHGALKDKTVLLVTHQVDFLQHVNLIMVMREGKIVQSGKYEELLESGTDFGALVAAHESSMDLAEKNAVMFIDNCQNMPKSFHASLVQGEQNDGEKPIDWSMSRKGNPKLIEDEERETGQVNFNLYKQYCTEAYGWVGVAIVILIFIMNQTSIMSSDYWLAYESASDHNFSLSSFINIYWIITAVSCVILLIRIFFLTLMGLKTAQSFFNQTLQGIVHAPMSFFDTTPSGRILTRVSNDQTNVDSVIPMVLGMTVLMYFQALSIIFVTCQNAWPTVFLMIPLIWLSFWYRGYYLTSSRELTRLDSITKAPIIHHFSQAITGVVTIRCFRKQDQYILDNTEKVNANLRMDFYNNGSNEWLGFRLELMGSFVLCIATMLMIFMPNTIISPEHVGLSLSYGLALNVMIFWAIYMNCSAENKMISIERMKQLASVSSEAAWNIEESLPSPNWPSHGDIEIKDLQVQYRQNTPLVLKGINLSIRGGEKIGVVGRTGSGKSTLVQVFFRLVEPSRGKIIIGNVDICKLGLHNLRSRFGIIPQDPVLFLGTVRSNIDPTGLYSDEEIWKSLERCQLKDVVAAKPEKLDASVDDSGDNWSIGQRQLLCLGRIMLKRSKILFMDEATASVDSQTDAVIQRIIREDFCGCTIITVAHRIPTVIECDRVLVIDDGWAKEFDKPLTLLERPSLFGGLVQEYATRSGNL